MFSLIRVCDCLSSEEEKSDISSNGSKIHAACFLLHYCMKYVVVERKPGNTLFFELAFLSSAAIRSFYYKVNQ